MRYNGLILDADICIKIGGYKKYKFLEILLSEISEKVYMHKYVYDNEVLTPQNAKEQINKLIRDGKIEILDENELSELDKMVYYSIIDKLKKVMVGTKEEGKNWGEVVSISMAKVKGIPYFMSDEGSLQKIIDTNLNTGSNNDITVIRVRQIIELIRDNPELKIDRKTAKAIWRSTGQSNEYFDEVIWKKDLS
ncbi:hypothetical protein [uncultured Clostridium sp.]|uniref:hypothetical protein n=1 Tax=uncultured Clostridium sp. TaxID=59620 RepID=UPI0025D8CCCF|nr:hypothetical protein [uncultured Clostridium sp.]